MGGLASQNTIRTGVLTQTPELLTALWRGIFFVRWRAPVAQRHLDAVSRDFAAASRPDRRLLYCGISGNGAGMPESGVQRQMVEMAFVILRQSSEFHLVLEGTSTQASLSRSMFRGLITAAKVGNRAMDVDHKGLALKIVVHDSLAACLPRLAVSPLVDLFPSAFQNEVEPLGILHD